MAPPMRRLFFCFTDLRDIAERSVIREAGKDRTTENTQKYFDRQE
jgi:hypothetical protein